MELYGRYRLFGSLLEGNACLGRSVSVPVSLLQVDIDLGGWLSSSVILLGSLSVDKVCQVHEVIREVDANETSDKLGSSFGETLVGLSQLRIPYSDPLIDPSILLPLVSVDLEYYDGWCALKSPRISVSGVVRRCHIED